MDDLKKFRVLYIWRMKFFMYGLMVLLLAGAAKYGIDTYHVVHDRKKKMEDYAEINMVNYELFNIQLWKEKTLEIIKGQIKAFEISQQMYDVLDDQIQIYLNSMYKQYFERGELGEVIIDEVKRNGQVNAFMLKMIETQVPELLKQINLKPQIPILSDRILAEIKENEPIIKQYMQAELLRLVLDEEDRRFRDRREVLYAKYNFDDLEATDAYLQEEVARLDLEIKNMILRLCLVVLALIVLAIIMGRMINFQSMVGALTLASIVLLVLGVSMPMIDIDARMNSFRFELFNEPIEFAEQIIYYQSKSIVEVTKTLWQGDTWDLQLVGILVFMFSIVFPFFKLLLSGFYLFSNKIQQSKLAKGVIFHLGKWSMADVFVVAIFMAYIGFYGIIASQLNSISQNQGGFAIETINYSKLSPGAFFFTAYTVLSIAISILISKHDMAKNGV